MPVRRRSLIERAFARGRLYRTKSCPTGKLYGKEPEPDEREGDWCLVNHGGYNFTLPKTMIFLGREECDIELQCQSVDKRHAVVTFDHYLRRFKVKDLSTANGTFVNGTKIPEQEYVTLEHQDALQLGHASTMYQVEHLERGPAGIAEDVNPLPMYSPSETDLPSWASPKEEESLPSWASSKEDESPMAECKHREPVAYFFDCSPDDLPGCIVEQTIEHTCCESIPESETARHDLDRSYSHDSIASFGLGHNTWPKKRYKPKKHVKELFDIMNSEDTSVVDGLIDPPQSRVLRGRGAPMNILPAELETVKKGTPLYGQPEWWGEEESDLNLGNECVKRMAIISPSNSVPKTRKFRSNGSMEHAGNLTSPDKDGKSQGDERNTVSIESSDQIQQNGVKDSENVPKEETTLARKSATPEGISNMAFTVDFGDEDSKKSTDGRSLSDFVPSKIRKSFRERKEKSAEKAAEKAAEKTGKSAEKVPEHSPANKSLTKEKSAIHNTHAKTNGRAVSEGREISPTHQHKIDELWNSSTPSKDLAIGKRSNMMTKSSVSRSMDLDDSHIDSPSAKVTKTSVKRRPPISSTLTKPKSVIRARKAVSQEIQPTQLNDSTSYLIDKMFQNTTGSVDSLKAKEDTISGSSEYDLYSESRQFDTQRKLKVPKELVKYESERSLKVTKDLINKTSAKQLELISPVISKKSLENSAKKDKEKNGEEDKVSESGTYTIEEEKDSKAEDEARRNIDKIFGVDQLSPQSLAEHEHGDLKLPVVDKEDNHLEATLKNINCELEEIERLEKLRVKRPPADSLDVEVGSVDPEDDLIADEEENPSTEVPNDAPKWVSQWAALTNQKSRKNSLGEMELSSPGSSISDDSKSAPKPNGLTRKRPGTGRRLPTIPPVAPSPAGSEQGIIKESPQTSRSDLTVNGTIVTPQQRGVKISSHVSARYEDTDTESVSLVKCDSDSVIDTSYRKSSSASVASLDTEVLLKDTQTVMAAMEQRVSSKSKHSQEKTQHNGDVLYDIGSDYNTDLDESIGLNATLDLDSDTSSVVAMVNGDEDFVKPSYFKSPRESLGRGKLKLKSESLPSKPVINMTGAGSKHSSSVRKHSTEEGKSVVSDILSDVNGDVSVRTSASEVSTEGGQFVRQGSKGKGQMSMTRPNRAFQLRRARADDEIETPKSASSSSLSISATSFSTNRSGGSLSNVSKLATTPQKPKRPMSGKFSDRQPDSARSQASLGAQIAQKSKENQANFQRADGGRHSLRVTRSMTIPVQQSSTPSTSTSSSKSRKSDTTSSSSNLRHSTSLRVQGVSARERSSSMTRTKTDSPKTAERNAWKRRKEYDPRKAVAEAKTKTKEPSRRKRDIDLYNQRQVTRSASFTNTHDLKLKLATYSQNDSISSADDLSRRSSATSDVFDDHSPKRGFVPYSSRTVSTVSSNLDDFELEHYTGSSSAHSTQDQQYSKKILYNNPHISAFTPPPRNPPPLSLYKPTPKRDFSKRGSVRQAVSFRKKQASPRSSSSAASTSTTSALSSTSSLSHRRRSADSVSLSTGWRSVDSFELYQSALNRKPPEADQKKKYQIVQSYDTIIVSSIYQLSLKLKTCTDRTLDKLREKEMIENGTHSPLDDIDNQTAVSEIPAYKSANQELAGVLKNLRKLEQHIKVMNKVLFPDDVNSPDTSKEKHEYLQQIERIRNELAGFQPIETPRAESWKNPAETASVESDCEELSQAENYY